MRPGTLGGSQWYSQEDGGGEWQALGIPGNAKVQAPAEGVRGHSLGPTGTPLSGKVIVRHGSQTLLAQNFVSYQLH